MRRRRSATQPVGSTANNSSVSSTVAVIATANAQPSGTAATSLRRSGSVVSSGTMRRTSASVLSANAVAGHPDAAAMAAAASNIALRAASRANDGNKL